MSWWEGQVYNIMTLLVPFDYTLRLSQPTKFIRVKQEEEELEITALSPGTVVIEVWFLGKHVFHSSQ